MGYMGAAWATLICYASMMVISYLMGRKYYPVEYNLKGGAFYLLISLGLYFISTYVNTVSLAVNYTINASLLFVFLMVIAFRERKFIKEVMHKA
jgi:hypothetical protein